jgi:hypothetical protein
MPLRDLFGRETKPLTDIAPVKPDERAPAERDASREQLLDQYIEATQNPPPGPGGVLGITEPWDIRAPVETPREYKSRIRRGPERSLPDARKTLEQADSAESRGDEGFAALRREDARDKAQGSTDSGSRRAWMILIGGCVLFLLLTWLLIALPAGQHAHTPPIWVY